MSTSPNVFAHMPLAVLTDPRITAEQAKARALGYSAGYAAGVKAAAQERDTEISQLKQQSKQDRERDQEQLARAVRAFSAAVIAAQERELPVLDSARDLVCSLAFDLARSVVGVSVSESSTEVAGVSVGALGAVTRALRASSHASAVTIHMSPADAHQIHEHWDDVRRQLGTDHGAEVVSDPAVDPGSAVAKYANGHVDASLTAAFERAQSALALALATAQADEESL